MSARGQSRPGRARARSGHVRYAAKAEITLAHWRRRARARSTKPRSDSNVFSPIVGFLEAEHLAGLAVGQGGFEFAELTGDRDFGEVALEQLAGRNSGGGRVVGRVEDLKAEGG